MLRPRRARVSRGTAGREDPSAEVDPGVPASCRAHPARVTAVSGSSTRPASPARPGFRKSAPRRAERAGRPGAASGPGAGRRGRGSGWFSRLRTRARRGARAARASQGPVRASARGRACAQPAAEERARELLRPGARRERRRRCGEPAAGSPDAQRLVGCVSNRGKGKRKAKAAGAAGDGEGAAQPSLRRPYPGLPSWACRAEPGAPQPWLSPTWPPSTCSRTSC